MLYLLGTYCILGGPNGSAVMAVGANVAVLADADAATMYPPVSPKR